MKIFTLSLTLLSMIQVWCLAQAEETSNDDDKIEFMDKQKLESFIFGGRVSMLNPAVSLMRIRARFKNLKYLRLKDQIEFWSESYPYRRCNAVVEGRSAEYFLLKIPHFKKCISQVNLTVGAYLHFLGQDYVNNLQKGQKVINILLKKHLALESKWKRLRKDLDAYTDRVDVINSRYTVLMKKMEQEWQNELTDLEADKLEILKDFKQTELYLDETQSKLEQYKIHDKDIEKDRWSLDPRLYSKKEFSHYPLPSLNPQPPFPKKSRQ